MGEDGLQSDPHRNRLCPGEEAVGSVRGVMWPSLESGGHQRPSEILGFVHSSSWSLS